MPLPILSARYEPTPADLLRLFERTEAACVSHLAGDPAALDVGTAYCNPHLDRVPDANNVRDVALPPGASPATAVAEVNAHYANLNARCAYWVMNPSAPEAQTRPMIDHLLSIGHRADAEDVLLLRATPNGPVAHVPDLKIIPARAAYRQSRELAVERAADRDGDPQFVEAQMDDLDNPHFDALLALVGDRPAGTLGVLSRGEVGRIESVFVSPRFRRQGVARALMSRALELCARSLFKHVFIQVTPENAPAQHLYRSFGFEKIGHSTKYRAPRTTR